MEHKPEFLHLCVWSGFGTLLGPEKTSPVGGWFSLVAVSGPGPSNASRGGALWFGGCGGGCGGFGVWWCVECCIVDASILLCLVLWFELFLC